MSNNKIKVRFNYGNENTVLVNQTQKGPLDLANLPINTTHLAKQQVSTASLKQPTETAKKELLEGNLHEFIKGAQNNVDAAQSKGQQVLQKATLNTYKSQQVLPNVETQANAAQTSKKSTLKIEDLDETVFNKNPQKAIEKPIQKKLEKADIPAVITGPNFKAIGKQGKAVKEYTKIQNAGNYQYTNIPVKDEDQFTGCFGCMRRKPKSYSIEKK